jgi:hypothetical protein
VPRRVPSLERALSGPARDRISGWRRPVRVVLNAQGPGKPDQAALDRERARLPLPGPRIVVFLGCASGAGQTVTALMTGRMLAVLRGIPVALLDLSQEPGPLTGHAGDAPVATVAGLLAGSPPEGVLAAAGRQGARLDVITSGAHPGPAALPHGPGAQGHVRDYGRLAGLIGRAYPMTMVDPGAAEVTHVLGIADQIVLVTSAGADAARSLALTQEWLRANHHDGLAARAVTLVNGVHRQNLSGAGQAEAVARGHCRAIVRIPWDAALAAGMARMGSLHPRTRHAYGALAGVLVAGLAAAPVPRKAAR